MKAKNLSKFCIVLSTVVALAACGGPGEVDPRDQFVGGYNYESTGKAEIKVGPLTYNIPLDGKGSFTVSKAGDKDKVMLVGYNDTINATVSGNQLILESNVVYTESSGVEIQLTFDYDKATLTENQLKWDSSVKAYATYSGYAAHGEGNVSVVATKQLK